MPLSIEQKQAVVPQHRRHEKDSGSPEVQIALLTARIRDVSEHLQSHKHDAHARRGLIMMVSRRNRLLRYLSRTNHDRYADTIKKLNLRK